MTTIGADPEVCVIDNEGLVVPSGWCFDKWQGQGMTIVPPPPPEPDMPPKGRTLRVPTASNFGFKLYEDGASLEFNFDPTETAAEMVSNLRTMLNMADRLVEETGYHMIIKPSLPITAATIARGGVALSRFGCDPDSTLWDDPHDPSSINAETCFNRFYGGHLHVGVPDGLYQEIYYDRRWQMSLACDLLLGLTDVIFDHSDEARLRRQVYGRVGRHRVQIYHDGKCGYEYRVPSNKWLTHPEIARFMFSMSQLAAHIACDDQLWSEMVQDLELDSVKYAINETDAGHAVLLYAGRVSRFCRQLAEIDPYAASLDIDYWFPMQWQLDNLTYDWQTAWNQ